MILQPKSDNLPQTTTAQGPSAKETNVQAAGENATPLVVAEKNANKYSSPAKKSSVSPMKQQMHTPQRQAQPQAIQQQQHKVSRTDNCNCPEIVEEKCKLQNPNDPTEQRKIIRYLRGRFLGKGGFAKCYEIRKLEPIETEEDQTKTWALKVVPKANLTRTKARQKLTSEIKIHRSLSNEYVVRFDRYFEDKENVYIMLDICHNQSLSDLVRRRKRLHEVEARYYIYQLVKAQEYIHSRKIIHRDLKLGNLFLTERMGLKVGDFGLAAQVFYQGEKKRTVCGTPNYLAPEVLDAQGGHSYEVDYWSIGVILYTMLYGRPPFESQEVKQTYKKIKSVTYSFPDHVQVCQQAKDFIKQCLVAAPEERMNLQEMLQHDFLAQVAIPKQIPVSTLVCAPAQAFVKQYVLPSVNPNAVNAMSPSPMKASNKQIRDKRMLNHMQTAPENVLRQVKTQKSLKSNEQMNANVGASPNDAHVRKNLMGMYSPLETNRNNSQCENGQIMASARDGTPTPNANNAIQGTPNGEGALVSEFDPLGSTAKKIEADQMQGALIDNFIQTQNNVLGFNPQGLPLTLTQTANEVMEPAVIRSNVGSPKNEHCLTASKVKSTGLHHTQNSSSSVAKRKRITKQSSMPMGVTTQFGQQNSDTKGHQFMKSPINKQSVSPMHEPREEREQLRGSEDNSAAQKMDRSSPSKQIGKMAGGLTNQVKGLQAIDSPEKQPKKDSKGVNNGTELAKIQATSAALFQPAILAQPCDAQPQTELVQQFVDFSSKYGLGYKLSNGSYGVLFNDSTKIITHPNLFHFDYIERQKSGGMSSTASASANTDGVQDHVSQYSFFEYPESINKKVVLLQHFKSYLDGNSKFKPLEFCFEKDGAPERPRSELPLSYIKKWKRARKAILLRNSNKVIQVLFQDQSELILCSGSGMVTFVNSKREVKTVPLNNPESNLEIEDPSLFKRLQYAKEVLVQMMTGSSSTGSTLQQVVQQAANRGSQSPTGRSRRANSGQYYALGECGSSTARQFANDQQYLDQKSDIKSTHSGITGKVMSPKVVRSRPINQDPTKTTQASLKSQVSQKMLGQSQASVKSSSVTNSGTRYKANGNRFDQTSSTNRSVGSKSSALNGSTSQRQHILRNPQMYQSTLVAQNNRLNTSAGGTGGRPTSSGGHVKGSSLGGNNNKVQQQLASVARLYASNNTQQAAPTTNKDQSSGNSSTGMIASGNASGIQGHLAPKTTSMKSPGKSFQHHANGTANNLKSHRNNKM